MQIRSRLLFRILLIVFLVFVLNGCGTKLQKPTGLEQETEEGEIVLQKDEEFLEEQLTDPVEDEEVQEDEIETVTEPVGKEANTIPQELPSIEKKTETKKPPTSAGTKKAEKSPTKPSQQSKPSTPLTQEKPDDSKKNDYQPSAPPLEPESKPEQKKSTIVFSIVISSTEIPLSPTEMEITDGDTVLNALIAITREKKIQMDYRGGQGASAYVEGIANVYEFDRGQGSGWMYRVNGVFPDRGAGAVSLRDGDRVEWLYTTDLGIDLNANLQPFRR